MEENARTERRTAKTNASSSHSRNLRLRHSTAVVRQNSKHADPAQVLNRPWEARVVFFAQKSRMVLSWRKSGKLNW